MATEVSDRELRLLRLRAQRLLPGHEAVGVTDAAATSLTIQAQDPPAAVLAVRPRTRGLTLEQVREQASDGTAVRAWLMRNTIHLFAADDLAWMRPLLAERSLMQAHNRFEQLGVSRDELDRLLGLIGDRVRREPLARAEARELVIGEGLDPGDHNERIYWFFHLAAVRGAIAVSPALDQKQTFVVPPPDRAMDRDEGYALLAHRFLDAYGPATPRDLAYWGKVTVTDAKRAFADQERLEEVATSRGPMWALPGSAEPPAPSDPVVRLLPVWENYLLGYEDRTPAVPEPHDRTPGAGKPSATLDGLAFGHWRLERDGDSVAVVVEPFGPVPRAAGEGLRAETADIGRFLGADAELRIERP